MMNKSDSMEGIPSRGVLPDQTADDDQIVRLTTAAAIAHVRGDIRARTEARNALARLRAKHLWAASAGTHRSTWTGDRGGGGNASNLGWYCRAADGDPLREAIDQLAKNSASAAWYAGADRGEVFAGAIYRYGVLLNEQPDLPPAKAINRSVSWALHHMMAADNVEHHPREKKRNPEYTKWTPKLLDEVVEAVYPGLRAAFKADAASAEADAAAFLEDLEA